ncbi:hypothetical protein [Bacillus thuringiensis]|uniref:hypothetical protein n=1 Tax=Bacillus thuringiensis TaxID=1428 RepID=UPI0011460FEA|nr:hypothetical protein [Bacillus thuringiensis]
MEGRILKILTNRQLESLLWDAEQRGYSNGCAKGYNFGYDEGRKADMMSKREINVGITECDGKPLTNEQIGMLEFMIHNYYKKDMDICLCDVERVLKKKDKW